MNKLIYKYKMSDKKDVEHVMRTKCWTNRRRMCNKDKMSDKQLSDIF